MMSASIFRRHVIVAAVATATLLGSTPALAQKAIAPPACSFDTAAHTDMLTLEFSLRAYRGTDSLPDPGLTADIGAMMRARFAPPATISQLLYPNTYRPRHGNHGFTSVFGTLQFDMPPKGEARDLKWFAASLDQGTDDALEKALQAALKSEDATFIAPPSGTKNPLQIRVQFLATDDTLTHAALARLKVPMVRIDSGGAPMESHTVVPRDFIESATKARSEFEIMVDAAGHPVKESIQIIAAPSLSAAHDALLLLLEDRWHPFFVAGCAVPVRFRAVSGR